MPRRSRHILHRVTSVGRGGERTRDHQTMTGSQGAVSMKRATKPRAGVLWLVCSVLGCSSSSAPPSTATVQFAYVNRLCTGTFITLQFLIDNAVVDTETMRNGQTSRAHVTTAGPHVLGAHIPSSGLSIVPDTTVNLNAGEAFTRQVVSITPEC